MVCFLSDVANLPSCNLTYLSSGPPSQSLGVDPVDPSIMRKPPRKKNAPIITRRLLYRVLFSASMIVAGTLFVYIFALSDDRMSKREQTMVGEFFIVGLRQSSQSPQLFRLSHPLSSSTSSPQSRTEVSIAVLPRTRCW